MLQRLRHGHRGSGIQWPCTAEAPDGTERLCVDGRFWSDPEVCEEYGHDLLTGAANTATDYRALDPRGRAILKAAHYQPPHEEPDEEFPLLLTTGRTVNHFHTRTRTGRAPELAGAAPTCGWSCPSPTPPRSGWPTATWCGSSRPGATWARARPRRRRAGHQAGRGG